MAELTGKRVLLLRPEAQEVASPEAAPTAEMLFRSRGADVTQIALARLAPPTDIVRLEQARADVARGAFDWLVFTSVHGVTRFFSAPRTESPYPVQIACIGAATALSLTACGLTPSLVATESHGEGLATELSARLGASRSRILLARAEVARSVLPEMLRARGHTVEDVAVYKSELAEDRSTALQAWLAAGGARVVVFSSPNSVDAFLALGGAAHASAAGIHYVSIGPVTTARCRERQLQVAVEANPSTFPALAEAVGAHFTG